jgi:uncharacterized membrane protein
MSKFTNQDQNDINTRVLKDTPGRSLTKAITWRIFGSLATFLVAFVIFRQYSEKGLADVLEGATIVTIFDFTSKIILYYLHERLWTNINWGKYMKRHYWRQKAWRKLYRSMHKNEEK